jgi:N-acetylneuraminic acid mutarotase
MPTPRANGAAAVLGGKLYVVGGGNEVTTALSTVEAYDPSTDSWTSLASLPRGRVYLAAAATNGRLVALGGATGDASPFQTSAVPDVDIYDPATNSWTMGAPMPFPNYTLTAAALGGTVYVAGGYSHIQGFQQPLAAVHAYDVAADSWTARAALPTPRGQAGAAVVGGTLYVAGGYCHTCGGNRSVVEAFDPTTNVWTSRASLPFSPWGIVLGELNGFLYGAGGSLTSGDTPTGRLAIYAP